MSYTPFLAFVHRHDDVIFVLEVFTMFNLVLCCVYAMASFHPLILHVTRVYFVGHHQCLEGFGTGRERIRRMAAFGAAEVRNVYNNYTSIYTASCDLQEMVL